jgi:hypothetical protein
MPSSSSEALSISAMKKVEGGHEEKRIEMDKG